MCESEKLGFDEYVKSLACHITDDEASEFINSKIIGAKNGQNAMPAESFHKDILVFESIFRNYHKVKGLQK